MDLLPQKSVKLIKNFREDIDELFGNWETFPLYKKQFFPKVDIQENPDKFVFQAEIPGIDPNHIKIFLKKDNILVIQGNTEEENRIEKEGFLKIERFSGNFYREFPLPSTIKLNEIRAHSKRGILEIVLPKAEIDEKKIEKVIEIETTE